MSEPAIGLLVEDLLEDEDGKSGTGNDVFLRCSDDPALRFWNQGGDQIPEFLRESSFLFDGSDGTGSRLLSTTDYVIYDKNQSKTTDSHEKKILTVSDDGRIERPYMLDVEYEPERFLKRFSNNAYNRVHYNPKRVLIRSLLILIDFSDSMKEADFKPTRIQCVEQLCMEFVTSYFEHNPISSLGIISLRDREAVVLSPPSRNVVAVREKLEALISASDEISGEFQPMGDPSLKAGLEKVLMLHEASSQPYCSKEILIIFGSCFTRDSGNIEDVLPKLQEHNIRVNVISMSPELRILKLFAQTTGGDYIMCSNRGVVQEALRHLAKPCHASNSDRLSKDLILMGFPESNTMATASLCICHNQLRFDGYVCPRCLGRACMIPSTCKACDVTLSSSIDIARCQNMDSLIPPFIPTPMGENMSCFSCARKFESGGGQCPLCLTSFCFDCDIFAHSHLKLCPGCCHNKLTKQQGIHEPHKRNNQLFLPSSHSHANFLNQVIKIAAATTGHS